MNCVIQKDRQILLNRILNSLMNFIIVLSIQVISAFIPTTFQNSVNCEAFHVLMWQKIILNVYFILFSPFPIKHANTVMTIFGFTSTRSSGKAYILAPIFRATEMAYLEKKKHKENILVFVIYCVFI